MKGREDGGDRSEAAKVLIDPLKEFNFMLQAAPDSG